MDRGKTNDPGEDIGAKLSLTGRTVRSRMMWAGPLVRMKQDRLPEGAEEVNQGGRTEKGHITFKMGRPQECKKGGRG